LNLGEFREREVEPLARELRERVRRWTGIPTCVGIAPTKTLSKVANFIAKKRPQYLGVCDLRSSQVRAELLSTVPVDEVWGIGAASAAKLAKIGVQRLKTKSATSPRSECLYAQSTYPAPLANAAVQLGPSRFVHGLSALDPSTCFAPARLHLGDAQ